VKPPKTAALRPTFGIGIVIGAAILLASHMSGSDPALGVVLGAGAGLAFGLARRPQPTPVAASGVDSTGTGDDDTESGSD
jgi:hypothetical protein